MSLEQPQNKAAVQSVSVSAPASTIPPHQPNFICLKPLPTRAQLPRIEQASALIADKALTVPAEIVEGLLHQNTKGVIASGSKAGKTWLLLDLAVSVATGTPFLNRKTSQGKVLFVNFEIDRVFIKPRLQAVKQRKSVENLDNLHILNLRGHTVDFESMTESIVKSVEKDGYTLIILDPIYKLMVGGSENTAKGVKKLCQQVEQLSGQSGAAVVFSHHFTKGNQAKKAAIDRMSGSGVFARDADTIMTLTEHQEEGCYVVELTLRNLPPQPAFVVEFDYPIMVERTDLSPTELKKNGEDQAEDLDALLDLVQEKGLTTGEWEVAAKEKGYSRATFFRKKGKLEQAGIVQFDQATKKWGCSNHDETDTHLQTPETSETIETTHAPNHQATESNTPEPENNNG